MPLSLLRNSAIIASTPRTGLAAIRPMCSQALLGLTAAHAEELQQYLLAIARTGEAVLGVQNAYGQRYIIDFAMTTAVGTAVVRSTWIVLAGQDVPRLTSCYIL